MRAQPLYAPSVRDVAQHFGLLKAFQALALRALRIRPVVLLSRGAAVPDCSPREGDGVRPVTPADAPLFDEAGFRPGMLQRKLADGPGWIKLDRDRLVAWCFLGLTHSQIADWLVVRTDSPTALWGTGTWVHRDFRGSGVAAQIRAHSFLWYRDQGYREQLSWINLTNYGSLRLAHKLGVRVIGRVTYVRLLGVALVYDGSHWHLGRWTAARPLVLSMERIRRDRGGAASSSMEAASPSTLPRG